LLVVATTKNEKSTNLLSKTIAQLHHYFVSWLFLTTV
jgi:hypothetical protein